MIFNYYNIKKKKRNKYLILIFDMYRQEENYYLTFVGVVISDNT